MIRSGSGSPPVYSARLSVSSSSEPRSNPRDAQPPPRRHYLPAAAVVERHVEDRLGVARRAGLSLGDLGLQSRAEPFSLAQDPNLNALGIQLVDLAVAG